MFKVHDTVKVKEPFQDSFPFKYKIVEIVTHEDGQQAFILEEVGAFDLKYLEAAE